jgi:hypothetical protein
MTSCSWDLLEKPAVVQPLKKIPECYGNLRFITVLIRVLHWSLPWTRSMQSIPPQLMSLRSISIVSTHLHRGLPNGLFRSGFPTKILYAFLFSAHSCYMPCPFHPPWLDQSNYTWRRLQVMKLLIMQSFLQPPITSSLFGPNILLMSLFSKSMFLP